MSVDERPGARLEKPNGDVPTQRRHWSSYLVHDLQLEPPRIRLVGIIGAGVDETGRATVGFAFSRAPDVIELVSSDGAHTLSFTWEIGVKLVALLPILLAQCRIVRVGGIAPGEEVGAAFRVEGGRRALLRCSWEAGSKGIWRGWDKDDPTSLRITFSEASAQAFAEALLARIAENGTLGPLPRSRSR